MAFHFQEEYLHHKKSPFLLSLYELRPWRRFEVDALIVPGLSASKTTLLYATSLLPKETRGKYGDFLMKMQAHPLFDRIREKWDERPSSDVFYWNLRRRCAAQPHYKTSPREYRLLIDWLGWDMERYLPACHGEPTAVGQLVTVPVNTSKAMLAEFDRL